MLHFIAKKIEKPNFLLPLKSLPKKQEYRFKILTFVLNHFLTCKTSKIM